MLVFNSETGEPPKTEADVIKVPSAPSPMVERSCAELRNVETRDLLPRDFSEFVSKFFLLKKVRMC